VKISVIIPACNAELCLGACLDSVFAQTLLPHEVFLINDGSTDTTGNVARKFGDRILYIEQENSGQGAARNAGLALATGTFIAFLDADDYWRPTFLERCIGFLCKHPEAVAVSTGLIVKLFDGSERILPKCLTHSDGHKREMVLDDFFSFWAKEDHVRTGSAVIRRSVIDRAGFQRADLRVSQDLEYWGYIATFGKWGFIPEPLWVGNSRSAGARTGWSGKYSLRRRLCPTVEAWQERLLPRISPEQMPSFRIVRGRVAAGYGHNHILAGRRSEARRIFDRYGSEMPSNPITSLLRRGTALGSLGWLTACAAVCFREWLKNHALALKTIVQRP
jgi:hypothetical protein